MGCEVFIEYPVKIAVAKIVFEENFLTLNTFLVAKNKKYTFAKMLKIIITIGVVLVAVALLSIRILLKPNGQFSSQHISQSKAMRERGIGCVTSQDRQTRQHKNMNIKDL